MRCSRMWVIKLLWSILFVPLYARSVPYDSGIEGVNYDSYNAGYWSNGQQYPPVSPDHYKNLADNVQSSNTVKHAPPVDDRQTYLSVHDGYRYQAVPAEPGYNQNAYEYDWRNSQLRRYGYVFNKNTQALDSWLAGKASNAYLPPTNQQQWPIAHTITGQQVAQSGYQPNYYPEANAHKNEKEKSPDYPSYVQNKEFHVTNTSNERNAYGADRKEKQDIKVYANKETTQYEKAYQKSPEVQKSGTNTKWSMDSSTPKASNVGKQPGMGSHLYNASDKPKLKYHSSTKPKKESSNVQNKDVTKVKPHSKETSDSVIDYSSKKPSTKVPEMQGNKVNKPIKGNVSPKMKNELPTTVDYDYSDHDCDYCEYDYPEEEMSKDKDLDQDNLKEEFLKTIDTKFRSLVFNPSAQSHEKFQSCSTPQNETGNCKYVQHCLLSNIIGGIDKFMSSVCIIQDRYLGVCCPEFPVTVIDVNWDEVASMPGNSSNNNTEVKYQTECGVSSKTRIVGGSKSDPKAWPWMAALMTMNKGQFYCGGALINDRYVLTAAHCTFRIPKNQILVRLGEYDFKVKDEESPAEDFPVVQIKRHGQYSRRTLEHDIALLKLGRPVKFSKSIGTICLPENGTFIGQVATLAGWGNTKGGGPSSQVLLEIGLPVVTNQNCSAEHGMTIPESFICTKSEDKLGGACNGDSGGPLMLLDDESKRWKVIGVVSWGRRGCDPKFPTAYSRVTKYMDWIKANAT